MKQLHLPRELWKRLTRHQRNTTGYTRPFRLRLERLEDRTLLTCNPPALIPPMPPKPPPDGELTLCQVLVDNQNGVDGLNAAKTATVSPDGKHVYVTGRADDSVSLFNRNLLFGSLQFVESYRGVLGVRGAYLVVVSSDGDHVYTIGADDHSVALFTRNENNGALAHRKSYTDGVNGIDGLLNPNGMVLTSDGKHLYVAGYGENEVAIFSRDALSGELAFVGIVTHSELIGPTTLAVSPDNLYLYATAYLSDAILVFKRDAGTGLLQHVQTIKNTSGNNFGLRGVDSVAIAPDNGHLYSAGRAEDSLSVFDREKNTGRLTFLYLADQPRRDIGPLLGNRVTVNPDGRTILVSSNKAGVREFRRDITTGKLTLAEKYATTKRCDTAERCDTGGELVRAGSTAISPDGRNVYVLSWDDETGVDGDRLTVYVVGPSAWITGKREPNEGTPVDLNKGVVAMFNKPGIDPQIGNDIFTCHVDWGDDSPTQTVTGEILINGNTGRRTWGTCNVTKTYSNNKPGRDYKARVWVTDDHGGKSQERLATITVLKVAPRIESLCAASIREGEQRYTENFSSDPAWVTNNKARYLWSPSDGTYAFTQVNIDHGGEYAYCDIGYDGGSFVLDWDMKVDSTEYASDVRFGLFDTDMNAAENGSYVYLSFSHEDGGRRVWLISRNESSTDELTSRSAGEFSLNIWYRIRLRYDARRMELVAEITERDSGRVFETLSIQNTGRFAADMGRIGMSNVRHGIFQVANAKSSGKIDNVVFARALNYAEDFASNPTGWVTNNPSRYRWSPADQTYAITQTNINGAGEYAYRDAGYNGGSFRLRWDMQVSAVDYASDIRFGLFDSDLNAAENGSYAYVSFIREDRGLRAWLISRNDENSELTKTCLDREFELNTWYEVTLHYDAVTRKLTAEIVDRRTSQEFCSLSITNAGRFASDMGRIGASNIRQGSFQAPGATASGKIDNIEFSRPFLEVESFSSDPSWVTNNPNRYQWKGDETYQATQVNINNGGEYVYHEVGYDGGSFSLDWDIQMLTNDYASDVRFGLFDSDLNAAENGSYAYVSFTREDRGRRVWLISRNELDIEKFDSRLSREFSLNVWYRVTLRYDARKQSLTAEIKERDTGQIFGSLSIGDAGRFAKDMGRTGMSNLRNGKFQVPGAQSSAKIDNVFFREGLGEGTVVLSGEFTDPGLNDTHIVGVTWGDNSSPPAPLHLAVRERRFSVSHSYRDNPPAGQPCFTITATVSDNDGGSNSKSHCVPVKNQPPIVIPSPSVFTDEGLLLDFVVAIATFKDFGIDDTHTAQISWGDGTTCAGVVHPTGGAVTGKHVYADNGSYIVTVTVIDDDGGVGSASFPIVVYNAAPIVDPIEDRTVKEGESFSVPIKFRDDGSRDTHKLTVDWGDGTTIEEPSVVETPFGSSCTSTATPLMGSAIARHCYADDGIYIVTVNVTDDDGGSDTTTFKVAVTNVSPKLDPVPQVILMADEGRPFDVNWGFVDPGFGPTESWSYRIDWGDNSSADVGVPIIPVPGSCSTPTSGTIKGTHIFADNGRFTVTITVFDDDGGVGSETFIVDVKNIVPTLQLNLRPAPISIAEGTRIDLPGLGSFSDPAFFDVHLMNKKEFTYEIDWGDGHKDRETLPHSDSRVVNGSPGIPTTGRFDGSHCYADNRASNGPYTVTVTVSDDNDGVARHQFPVIVTNVAPTLFVVGNREATVGEVLAIPDVGVFTDPAFLDTSLGNVKRFTYSINWGDGTVESGNASFTNGACGVPTVGSIPPVQHKYNSVGTFTVGLTVTDDDGGTASEQFEIVVRQPIGILAESESPVELVPAIAVSAIYGPLPPWDFFRSVTAVVSASTSPSGHEATLIYGPLPWNVWRAQSESESIDSSLSGDLTSITSSIGDSFPLSKPITGNTISSTAAEGESTRMPPILTVIGNHAVNEGRVPIPEIGAFMDLDSPGPFQCAIDWGAVFAPPAPPCIVRISETGTRPASAGWIDGVTPYDDNRLEPYMVRVSLSDESATSQESFFLTVNNVAPTADLGNNGPVNEGSSAQVCSMNVTDPSEADTRAGFRYAFDFRGDGWDVGDGTYLGSAMNPCTNVPKALLREPPGNLVVRGRVLDKDNGFQLGDYLTEIEVKNARPVAVDDYYSFDGNGVLTVGTDTGLLSNDSDPGGDPLVVKDGNSCPSANTLGTIAISPDRRTIVVCTNGSFTYTPPSAKFSGIVTFAYTAIDDGTPAFESDPATVRIAVRVNASVSGRIFADVHPRDAAYGPFTEDVYAGVTVKLCKQDETNCPEKTTTTDDKGIYLFEALAATNYCVEVVLPPAVIDMGQLRSRCGLIGESTTWDFPLGWLQPTFVSPQLFLASNPMESRERACIMRKVLFYPHQSMNLPPYCDPSHPPDAKANSTIQSAVDHVMSVVDSWFDQQGK